MVLQVLVLALCQGCSGNDALKQHQSSTLEIAHKSQLGEGRARDSAPCNIVTIAVQSAQFEIV